MFKVSSYTHSFSSECHVKISLIKIDIKLEELNLLMFQKLVFCKPTRQLLYQWRM